MLEINIPYTELYDEINNEFIHVNDCKIVLEHSLVSISKWESEWKKPFLSEKQKTYEETLSYIKCMTITQDVPDNVYRCLSENNIDEIDKYINDERTATVFSHQSKSLKNKEFITSELIYYWMTCFQIPSEYQYWHLSRLLTLIRICEVKNEPKKKMSMSEITNRNKALNEMRKKQLKTSG